MKQRKQPRSKTESKAAPALAKILTGGQRRKLDRMHRYRCQAILRRMAKGMSYSAADKNTQHVFDTVDWDEIENRLQRFRGMVCGIGIVLADGKVFDSQNVSFSAAVRGLAKRIALEAQGLRRLVASIGPKPSFSKAVSPRKTQRRPYGTMRQLTQHFTLGQLKAALKVVAKCRRDAPYVEARGGPALTAEQHGVIVHEIRRIQAGVIRLKEAVRKKLLIAIVFDYNLHDAWARTFMLADFTMELASFIRQ
jgi:hypothetical protein